MWTIELGLRQFVKTTAESSLMWTFTRKHICYSPYVRNFIVQTGIPMSEHFSDLRPFAYWDPHMHMGIPVWETMQMGIQDLISHMEIFPICIRLVTEISLYAYGHRANPRMHGDYVSCDPRMQTGTSVIPICTRGLILIPMCIRGFCVMQSLHACGDLDTPVCIRGLI